MYFPIEIFSEIISYTGGKQKKHNRFEMNEYYSIYEERHFYIYKMIKRTKCFITIQVIKTYSSKKGSYDFDIQVEHKEGSVVRKKIFVDDKDQETLFINNNNVRPYNKITANFNKQEWVIAKQQIKKSIDNMQDNMTREMKIKLLPLSSCESLYLNYYL